MQANVKQTNLRATLALQRALIALFVCAAASIVAIYLASPAIYVLALQATPRAANTRQPITTLFPAAILTVVTVLTVGVLRRGACDRRLDDRRRYRRYGAWAQGRRGRGEAPAHAS